MIWSWTWMASFALFVAALLGCGSMSSIAHADDASEETVSWPPTTTQLKAEARDLFAREAFEGLYDSDQLDSAILLDEEAVAALVSDGGHAIPGAFHSSYAQEGAEAIGLLIPRAGIDPHRECPSPADVAVLKVKTSDDVIPQTVITLGPCI